jgi:MoxR-like ATPase
MAVKEKINALLKELNKGIYEKEEAIRLALLSSIAGESIFLLGPPGVAKSLIARRLKFAYKGKGGDKGPKVFEYLMSRFSTPDEIFGPVSISKLKNDDRYERIIEGYLPSADVVFLDEIWKAGPSIQNALLTVINEKKFRNGDTEIDVPMKALISASNELPARDEGLEALWDRFLIRLYVDGIKDENNFNTMIAEDLNLYEDTVSEKISDDEYKAWSERINAVKIPDNVFKVIDVIRKKTAADNEKEDVEQPLYISDRRWRKIIRLLRASAFLNGRKEVNLMDCFLIKDCIWDEYSQRDAVFQYVSSAIEEHGYTVSVDIPVLKKELESIDNDVKEWTRGEKSVEYQVPKIHKINNQKYYKIKTEGSQYEDHNLIQIDDMKKVIENSFIKVELFTEYSYRNSRTVSLKRSPKENKIIISNDDDKNEEEFDIECESETRQELQPYIKSAHPNAIKGWDKRIKTVQTKADNLKTQIERYRTHDLKHVHDNLFVDKEYADIVEKNLNDLETEIEKCEIEADRIHSCYHNIEPSKNSSELKLLEE